MFGATSETKEDCQNQCGKYLWQVKNWIHPNYKISDDDYMCCEFKDDPSDYQCNLHYNDVGNGDTQVTATTVVDNGCDSSYFSANEF